MRKFISSLVVLLSGAAIGFYIYSSLYPTMQIKESANENKKGLIAPLLPLSKQPQTQLSTENLKKFFQNPVISSYQRLDNQRAVQNKALPWEFFVSLIAVILLLFFLKELQPTLKLNEGVDQDPVKNRNELLKKLEHLMTQLKNEKVKDYPQYLLNIDHLVRNYFEVVYHIQTTSTTQEFLSLADNNPLIETQTRAQLTTFLQNNDQIKFAKHQPTNEELIEVSHIAKGLIEESK